MSREPPGYYFGKRVLFPECSCRWSSLERRAVHFDFSYGAASTGMLEFLFLRTRLYRSYYWSEQNETEKPSDEPPTDREHRPGARADQAHRARMIARSTICYGCFSLVITFRFCCLVLYIIALIFQSSIEYFLVTTVVVICTVVRQQSAVCTELHCVEKLLAQATFVCKRTSTIRLSIQNFRFLSCPVRNEWQLNQVIR